MYVITETPESAAARLLGRALQPADGIPAGEIARAQRRLGRAVPEALRRFYAAAGNCDTLARSFEQIAPPDALELADGKLVFAEENQGVCIWGADLADGTVYQSAGEGWFPEGLALEPFLVLLLYCNCAQGGFAYCGIRDAEDLEEFPRELPGGWTRAVEHRGLFIFSRGDALLWWLAEGGNPPEELYLSCREREPFDELCGEWGFDEL